MKVLRSMFIRKCTVAYLIKSKSYVVNELFIKYELFGGSYDYNKISFSWRSWHVLVNLGTLSQISLHTRLEVPVFRASVY